MLLNAVPWDEATLSERLVAVCTCAFGAELPSKLEATMYSRRGVVSSATGSPASRHQIGMQ